MSFCLNLAVSNPLCCTGLPRRRRPGPCAVFCLPYSVYLSVTIPLWGMGLPNMRPAGVSLARGALAINPRAPQALFGPICTFTPLPYRQKSLVEQWAPIQAPSGPICRTYRGYALVGHEVAEQAPRERVLRKRRSRRKPHGAPSPYRRSSGLYVFFCLYRTSSDP